MKLKQLNHLWWSGLVDKGGLGGAIADGPFGDCLLPAPAEWTPVSVEESPFEFECFDVQVPADGWDYGLCLEIVSYCQFRISTQIDQSTLNIHSTFNRNRPHSSTGPNANRGPNISSNLKLKNTVLDLCISFGINCDWKTEWDGETEIDAQEGDRWWQGDIDAGSVTATYAVILGPGQVYCFDVVEDLDWFRGSKQAVDHGPFESDTVAVDDCSLDFDGNQQFLSEDSFINDHFLIAPDRDLSWRRVSELAWTGCV